MPARDVPRNVGDYAGEERDREHRDRGQLSPGGERSGDVAEDDSQSVLTDDGREVVGHRCTK